MIEYFHGVKTGLGSPRSIKGLPYLDYKLRSVYVDFLNDYAFFWSSGRGSVFPFHDFMSELILYRLGSDNCKYIRGKNTEAYVDIIYYPSNSYIEVETGFKKSLDRLLYRLRKYSNWFYIVVPNQNVKRRYLADVPRFHGRIYSLKEFYALNSY